MGPKNDLRADPNFGKSSFFKAKMTSKKIRPPRADNPEEGMMKCWTG